MVARLVRAALTHRTVVFLLATVVVLLGLYEAWQAPLDVFPEFAPPIVEIQTEAPGFAAPDVEALVTTPLELALAGAPEIKNLRSTSTPGLSVITVVFPYGANPLRARQFVIERLALAAEQLPRGVKPAVAPLSSALTYILAIGLRAGPEMSPLTLRDLAEWTIRPRLLGVEGIANVLVFGGNSRQIHITTTPERLWAARTSLDDLADAVAATDAPAGSGFFDRAGQRLPTWLDGRIHTPADLARAPLPAHDGMALSVGAVADVAEGPGVAVGGATVNGEPGVVLLVTRQPGVNVVAVTAAVEDALQAVTRVLPPGVRVDPAMFRQATFIAHALGNLRRALLAGAVLVVLVLIVFIGNLRAALISVVAIPLSLLTAVAVLRAAGVTINVMVLGGLAIATGEVVDDAIIDVENAWRRLRSAPAGSRAFDIVLAASVEVRSAVVYATAMVALVFLPVFMLGGLEGALFRPLAAAYVLATLASLGVALTVTPALALVLLPGAVRQNPKPPRLMTTLRRHYERALLRVLAHPAAVIVASAVTVLAGVALTPLLRLEFLPDFHETNFVMHMTGAPGVGLDESARVGAVAARALLDVPGVQSVAQQIGRSTLSEDTWGAERSELLVQLAADVDAAHITQMIRDRVAQIGGFAFDLKQFLNERIEELLEGTGAAIVVHLRGHELGSLEQAARTVSERVAAVPGAVDVYAPGALTAPGIHIRPRRDEMLRLGVPVSTVERALRSALGGLPVGRLVEGERQADVVLRLATDASSDPTRIARLPLISSNGRVLPLSAVADVEVTPLRNAISHEDGVRTIVVRLDASGRSLEQVARDVAHTVADVALPAGVYAEVGGEYVAARTAQQRLLGLGALALVGIFALLVFDFQSVRLAALTMVNVPLAFVGGLAAVLLGAGGRLSLGAIVGFVTVFGITIRNGIVLIAHFRHVEAERGHALDHIEIATAAANRLAPILMTALTTGIALLPLLALGGRAGGEIEQPMALVIVGGLVTSTWLNLFVVPIWYARAAAPRA
ncbi:MAG: efflux RND transporter permease subunit [Deltaproteobacteria bacterium]|nr:efflux RND transporter permease subunit [Deltaproteobacteria bacterium]MBI3391089.1 efflux RND transporter permease subunit [Deltaproteobacteria bacterium]